MASLTTTKLLYTSVSAFFGTAGGVAATPFGYIYRDGNVVTRAKLNAEDISVHGEDLPVGIFSGAKDLAVVVPLAQLGDFSVLDKSLGIDAGGGETITFGDPSESRLLPQISVAFVGSDVNGDTWRVDIPYASVRSDAELTLGPTQRSVAAVEFASLAGGSYPTIKHASGDVTATLSGDSLAITAGYHKVAGEGGAADDWDAFSGLGAADDENIYRFQPASSSYAITVTHAAGVIELIGGVGTTFAMGGSVAALKDYIDLQYDHANTKLVEVGRWDQPA